MWVIIGSLCAGAVGIFTIITLYIIFHYLTLYHYFKEFFEGLLYHSILDLHLYSIYTTFIPVLKEHLQLRKF